MYQTRFLIVLEETWSAVNHLDWTRKAARGPFGDSDNKSSKHIQGKKNYSNVTVKLTDSKQR